MTSLFTRRQCCFGAAALAALPWPATAQPSAGSWPERPLRFVIPGVPGALFDVLARQLAEQMAPALGKPVVADNRPGAGGLLAMRHLASSAPDGHTIGIASFTQLAVNPWMYEKPAYDPVVDFEPVSLLFHGPIMQAVRADSPIHSFAQWLRTARSQPGRFSYASAGVGQPPHVLFELVEHRAGLHVVHIPYRGGHAAVAGLLAGDVDMVFEGAGSLLPLVRAGRLRPLAVTGDERIAMLPDVPTFAEHGIAGIENSWMGIVAPAGTPTAVVARLQREIVRALQVPEVRDSYENQGRLPLGSTPDAFAALLRESVPKWRELVRVAGLKPV